MKNKDGFDTAFLHALLGASAASSHEEAASQLFRDYIRSRADEVRTDQMGNTVATSNPKGKFALLLSAHIDEIGWQVSSFCDNGLLKVRKVADMNTLNLVGQEVVIATEQGVVKGVMVCKSSGNNNVVPTIDDYFLDIDADSKESAEKLVAIGDFVTFSPNSDRSQEVITSKSIDNRAGVFILSQLFMRLAGSLNNIKLSVATTTQEEIGLRGMAVLARREQPDVCLNLDVTDALELDKKNLPEMGRGCVLYRNADSNPLLRKYIHDLAQTLHFPVQIALGRNITGGTDCSRIQLFSPSTAVADIAIPCKYMHTHHEKCSLSDLFSCICLLESCIRQMDSELSDGKILSFSY